MIQIQRRISRLPRWFLTLSAFKIGFVLAIIAVFIGVAGYVSRNPKGFSLASLVDDFYANGAAELGSIAITVLVIDTINNRRAINQEKRRLIHQMGSPDNSFAVEAARVLRLEGWLVDGTLRGKDFSKADLRNAELDNADLREAWFPGAKLNDAKLIEANLYNAWISEADLRGAKLIGADLREVNLRGAYLVGADLTGAKMQGAKLERSDLSNAILRSVEFDETTVLPNGRNWKKSDGLVL